MSLNTVEFRCSQCDKLLAVDTQHVGRAIKCPGCELVMTVPPHSSATIAGPIGESQPSVLPNANRLPVPAATADIRFNQSAPSLPEQQRLPHGNTGMHTASPSPSFASSYPVSNDPTVSKSSMGKSIAGLLVALVLAAVCCLGWMILTAIAGHEFGIVAWGIGGLIGFVAGAIAKNRSPVYCAAIAVIALCSIVFAKALVAGFLYIAAVSADLIEEMALLEPSRNRMAYVALDDAYNNHRLAIDEEEIAKTILAEYFQDGIDNESPIVDAGQAPLPKQAAGPGQQVEFQFAFNDPKKQLLMKMLRVSESYSANQRDELVKTSKERHANWIENEYEYAAVRRLMLNDRSLSDDLQRLAEIESSENKQIADFPIPFNISSINTAEDPTSRRLRTAVSKRIRTMSASELEAAVNEELVENPNYRPYPQAFAAMTEQLQRQNEFEGDLKTYSEYVTGAVGNKHVPELGNFDLMKVPQLSEDLGRKVNPQIAKLSKEDRNAMVTNFENRFAGAKNEKLEAKLVDEMAQNMGAGQGPKSFGEAFMSMMSWFDLLWIGLAASTAYATARRQGF